MTYNQVITRIKNLSLAHKQVRSFGRGLISDFLTNKRTKYIAIFIQDIPGSISLTDHMTQYGFRIWVLDLVHVSANTLENEQDVFSDTIRIAQDLLAQFNFLNDWKVETTGSLELVAEKFDDLVGGCYIDLKFSAIYPQNICSIPTTDDPFIPVDPTITDKTVYDLIYIATGNEGLNITTNGNDSNIPLLHNQKILLVTREYVTVFKVSNLPNQTEFTWNDSIITLGLPTMPNERFLFLYRNY